VPLRGQLRDAGPGDSARLFALGPNNHDPRVDLSIPLNLTECQKIAALLRGEYEDRAFLDRFYAAARYYRRSLQVFDAEPDVAYLDLVTCGEILANHYEYADTDLYDEKTIELLEWLESKAGEGAPQAKFLRGSLRQVKKRYILTIRRLLNDYFFQNHESKDAFLAISKDRIEESIKATYDLRSRFVHTGVDLSRFLIPSFQNEIQMPWLISDEKLMNLVAKSLSFKGLERVMRYCLIRFVHTHGIVIDPRLDADG
jgi:hypothetical protein